MRKMGMRLVEDRQEFDGHMKDFRLIPKSAE